MARQELSVSSQPKETSSTQSNTAILAAVALITLLAPINSTMITIALPAIRASFNVGVAEANWLVITYLVTMASAQPLAGKLGDSLGRRKIILLSMCYFTVATVIAAVAPTLILLIIFRVQQAIAIALALPNGAALIREVMPESRRARSFGFIGAVASLAAASGPALGGFIVGRAGWRGIFYVNLPILLAALVIGVRAFPNTKTDRESHTFDYFGSVLLLLSLVALVAFLTQSRQSWGPNLLLPIAGVAVLLVAFLVWWERQQSNPVIDLRFFRHRSFISSCGAIAFGNMSIYTTLLVLPVLLTEIAGWPSARVGLVLTALAGTSVVAAPLGGALADRFGRKWPTSAGLILALVGAVLLFFNATDPYVVPLMMSLGMIGLGQGLASAGMQTAVLESVRPSDAGVASGVFSTSRYIGSIVGSSLLSALLVTGGRGGYTPVFLFIITAAGLSVLSSLGIHSRPAEH